MKGPALLTMLMFLALAIVAYAQAAPRLILRGETKTLFGRVSSPAACLLGTYYSSYYHGCTRGAPQPSQR